MLKLKHVGSKDPELYTLSGINLGEVFFYYVEGVSPENQHNEAIFYLRTDCGAVVLNGSNMAHHYPESGFASERIWAIVDAEIHIQS